MAVRKRNKVLIVLVGLFVVLPLFLYALLRTPTVQTYITRQAASYLSKQLETDVEVGGVNISFFLDVIIEDVKINDLHNNNLLKVEKIIVDIKRIAFRKRTVIFRNIGLKNAEFALRKYKGEKELNLQFVIDYFSSDKEREAPHWHFITEGLTLENLHFIYQDNNEVFTDKGIDFKNLSIKNIFADFKDLSIVDDTINVHIRALSCKDISGFQLNSFTGLVSLSSTFLDIEDLQIITDDSDILMNLRFDYDDYSAYNSFVESVDIDIDMNKSFINLDDIAYFAPDMFGMANIVDIEGNFRGTIANLRGRDVIIQYADNTFFDGHFRLTGLPDFENTFINFNTSNFITTHDDLNKFRLPGYPAPATLDLPEELAQLGHITFKGNFTGFIDDFVAYGTFGSRLGMIKSDILLKRDAAQNISYKGQLAVMNFNIGQLLAPQSGLERISFDFELEGQGLSMETADISMDGNVSSFFFNGYNYENIRLAGDFQKKKFTGYFDIRDENIDLDFEGFVDFMPEKPIFDFSSDIKYAKLHKLNITEKETPRKLSAYMKCRFTGADLENIGGIFIIDDVIFQEEEKLLAIDNLHITNTAEDDNYKNIIINSDLFDFNLEGHFAYADLYGAFAGLINHYLPSYIQDTTIVEQDSDVALRYNFRVKNSMPLTDFFAPAFSISDDFFLSGNFLYSDYYFTAEGASQYVYVNDMFFENWSLNIKPENNSLIFNTGATHFSMSDDLLIDNLSLNSQSQNDSVLFALEWLNNVRHVRNSGDIKGYLSFETSPEVELKILSGRVFVNDSLWVVNPRNQIIFDSTAIAINNFSFRHNRQQILVDGIISEHPDQQLDITFTEFDISDFNPLLARYNLNFQGDLSGQVSLFDVYKSFGFVSDLQVVDFTFNDDLLGNLGVKSNWDRVQNRIMINSEIIFVGSVGENRPFHAQGFYYPGKEENALDIKVGFENFRLHLIEGYLADFSSDFRGLASGEVTVTGTPAKPDLNGVLSLRRASMKIDYLNTVYSFSDDIKITPDGLAFEGVILNDVRGGTAVLDGKIQHNYFNDMRLDLNIRKQNLLALNTTAASNEEFYGTVFATGLTRIHGPVENLTMDIVARSERHTRFFLSLESGTEVRENPFITFVSHDTIIETNNLQDPSARPNMTLNIDMEITPDAEAQIIFDAQVGDVIRARGQGNLQMAISMQGDFRMFGDYVIQEGDYLFILQNVINKRFRINEGSQISWSGDPMVANADVKAVYLLRAPLHDLFIATADTAQEFRKRVPVNCILSMTGNLLNPDISFDIDLPQSDENTRTQLRSIINTEAEMNRQMFALLALNRFLPPTSDFANVGLATGLEATSTEMLSNQLSNWLSQISSDFDLGVNYRMGDELTSDEVEVALSTQLFNDRVLIDGSVGTSATGQNTSQLVGDVNVELKLTEDGKFRMKFYNKSNAFDMIKHTAPYTQGIGFFYRREFDDFKNLFRKNEKD